MPQLTFAAPKQEYGHWTCDETGIDMISRDLEIALDSAFKRAASESHASFGIDLLLWALLDDDAVGEMLSMSAQDREVVRDTLWQRIDAGAPRTDGETEASPELQNALQQALLLADDAGTDVMPSDVLNVLLKENAGLLAALLTESVDSVSESTSVGAASAPGGQRDEGTEARPGDDPARGKDADVRWTSSVALSGNLAGSNARQSTLGNPGAAEQSQNQRTAERVSTAIRVDATPAAAASGQTGGGHDVPAGAVRLIKELDHHLSTSNIAGAVDLFTAQATVLISGAPSIRGREAIESALKRLHGAANAVDGTFAAQHDITACDEMGDGFVCHGTVAVDSAEAVTQRRFLVNLTATSDGLRIGAAAYVG